MKYYLILCLAIFSCNKQGNNNALKSNPKISQKIKEDDNINKREQELNYIKRRNSNIKHFKNQEFNNRTYKEMNDSLFALEKLLKNILIPTKVKDINKKGEINLQTFLPELGFGMLDALTTYEKEVSILCTTSFIFSDFFKEQGYKIDNISETNIEDIFSNAFAASYTITSIHSFKINEKENVNIYGIVSIDGQDIGPFKPNTLYALTVIEDNIYLIRKSISQELKELEKCMTIWNNTDGKSEDEIWKEYYDCYRKEFAHNEQFIPLKKEIEEMIKLIVEQQ